MVQSIAQGKNNMPSIGSSLARIAINNVSNGVLYRVSVKIVAIAPIYG